ncbi:MAG: hypothetical protein AAGI23_00090 [Bacteroidota bacterium]
MKLNQYIQPATLVLALMLTVTSTALAGGPWPQPKGGYYLKLSEWWVVFDEHFTDSGETDPNVTTGIYNTFLYGEYGVTDRATVLFNGALFSRNVMNNLRSSTTNEVIAKGEGLNSIGDIDVGLKYGLTKPGAALPVSASIILGLPTGATAGGELGNLQTGDGEFNQMIQIDAGQGFKVGKSPAYASAYTGFNNRTNGFSEEFRYGAEVGIGLVDQKLWLNTKLNVIESLKNGDTAATTNSTNIFANNTEFKSVAFEANYFVTKNVGISASYATVFYGEIIAAAPSYNVGVFVNMR